MFVDKLKKNDQNFQQLTGNSKGKGKSNDVKFIDYVSVTQATSSLNLWYRVPCLHNVVGYRSLCML